MKKLLLQYTQLLFIVTLLAACNKDNNTAQNVETGKGGSLARFTIYGDYIYTVDHQTLKTYSLANPKSPELISSINVGWDIETIYPYNGNLFIGSMNAMYIYTLDNPQKPTQKGIASHVRACDPVVALGDYAYVTVKSGRTCGGSLNALLIYDVKALDNPKQVNQITLKEPNGLGIKNNTLYICDGRSGLKVFDVTVPQEPALLTYREGYDYKDCIPLDDMLVCMVGQGMVIYDITNPRNPIFVTEIKR